MNINRECLLCLTKNIDLIEIFSNQGKELNIINVINAHFWFEIKDIECDNNKCICSPCWIKLKNFHTFYTHIYEIHNSIDWNLFNVKNESIIKEEEIVTNAFLQSFQDSTAMIIEARDEIDNGAGFKTETCENTVPRSDSENDNYIYSNEDEDSLSEEEVVLKKRKIKAKTKISKAERKIDFEQRSEEDQQIREFFKMECSLCSSKFDVFQNVKTHYRVEHKLNGYLVCCKKKFFKRCRALEHIQRHVNPDFFKCEICNKAYVDKPHLLKHMEMHKPDEEREKPFKCSLCPKSYAKKCYLDQHQKIHNNTSNEPSKEKTFTCHECGKNYACLRYLQSHRRVVHEAVNSHVCDVCAKVFKSKMFFQKHYQAVHSNIIPVKVQCQQCGIWIKEDGLKTHMFRHEDEKNIHICNICGKQSPNGRALSEHKKYAHLAQRTHKCTFCEKAFKRALSLREHMTLHTGEVLYTCPYCPKTFNSSANLHSHRKKIHPKEWEENRRYTVQ